jgi:hypothetical protein
MLNKKNISFCLLILPATLVMSIWACKNGKNEADISGITLNIRADRFEKDLFELDSLHKNNELKFLKDKYGNFFNLFAFQITSLGSADSILMLQRIEEFINDTNFKRIYNDCENLFGDFSEENTKLSKAFRYYKYYFPDKTIPRIVTLISGFSYPIVCDSVTLGIGLDMYMGPDYHYYSTLEPPLPVYLRNRMNKAFIICDAMKGWAESDYGIDESSARMIDFMISQGRLIYFLDKITPDEPDTIKSGYTASQLTWCKVNEKKIWAFFIDNKLLFSFDPNLMNKYVNDGPTTNGFPKESPGNIGKYIGWQIVKSYMENHREVTLQKLMEEKDLLKVFNESKYKPGK